MQGGMSRVGPDVHASRTRAAVLDVAIGELRGVRLRMSPGRVVEFLPTLPGPVRAVSAASSTIPRQVDEPPHGRVGLAAVVAAQVVLLALRAPVDAAERLVEHVERVVVVRSSVSAQPARRDATPGHAANDRVRRWSGGLCDGV